MRSAFTYAVIVLVLSYASQSCPADGPAVPARERMIRLSEVIPAPAHDVWRAWTTHDELQTFFGAENHVKIEVGGPYEIYFMMNAPEGSRGSEGCKVLAFVPDEMLAFSWNAPTTMPDVRKERTQVVLRLLPAGKNRTEVRLTQLGWGVSEQWDQAFAYFSKAWPNVLKGLREHFEGVTTDPTKEPSDSPAAKPEKTVPQFVYFIEPTRTTFLQDATETENAKIEEHFRYLQHLLADGKLILAGRTLQDQPLGLVIFEAPDQAAAQSIFENDPAVKAGIFKGRVVPYKVALQRE